MALNGTINGTTSNEYITGKIEWSATQNIVDNYSTITATLYFRKSSKASIATEGRFKGYIIINGNKHYIEYKTKLPTNDTWIKYGTATQQVEHNTDGSKSITISATGGNQESGTTFTSTSLSQSITLDTIPRSATITSAPNFNDEQNPTIKYNNSAGNAVDKLEACISFDGSNDDIAYRDISKTGTSYTFNLTTAERNVLRNGTKTANSRTVKFYIRTTIGDNTYLKSVSKTLTIINAEPTINPTVYDSETIDYFTEEPYSPTGDTSTYFIKGWSDATYTIGASAKKGATIVSQKVVCGSKSKTTASGTIENVESAKFVFSATDSRGNTVEKTITKTLINYFKPTINLEVSPPTAQGELEIKFSGKWFNGKLGNTQNIWRLFTITYEEDGAIIEQYDIKDDLTINGNEYSYSMTIPNLNYKATYTIYAHGYDYLYNVVNVNQTVKLLPVFDWGKDDFQFNVPVSFNEGFTLPDKVLWSGSYYMTEGQTANLNEAVSQQATGIVLVFSRYDIANSTPLNEYFSYHFVPKALVALQAGKGSIFNMSTSNQSFYSSKYLYIDDTAIRGHANNDLVGTGDSGINFNNNRFVLRYVIGV